MLLAAATGMHGAEAAQTWRGLAVAPEHCCTPYERGDYPYPQPVEARIVAGMGGWVYSPYTGRRFASRREKDISHIVALSEAHDSGLCAADAGTRWRFASDLLNLTLAALAVNRHQKSGKDAGEWLPRMNRCWFAARVVAIKRKYRLTVDAREARALEGVLSRCASTAMVVTDGREAVSASVEGARGGRGRRAAALGHQQERAHHLPRGARTASPRCGAVIRPTRSCATATAWCASEGADGDALQETGSGGGDSWHSS